MAQPSVNAQWIGCTCTASTLHKIIRTHKALGYEVFAVFAVYANPGDDDIRVIFKYNEKKSSQGQSEQS